MAFCLFILCLLASPGLAAAQGPSNLPWMSHGRMMGHGRMMHPGRHAVRPVLINFSAPWCYLCRKMQRLVFTDPAVAAMMTRDFDLVAVDITTEEAVAKHYAIKQVPTIIFLDPTHRPVLRLTGYLDRHHLTQAMRYVASRAYDRQDWDSYRNQN